jgi:hypothetical protein
MVTKTKKKKVHHFVHDAYIDSWRVQGRMFVFDLIEKHSFDPTGRNSVGGSGKYNNFTFDDSVISLLNYTFEERARRQESGGIYDVMLAFTNFMKDFDYEHKTENFLEDFYGEFEKNIAYAMQSVFNGELQIVSQDPRVFDGLIFFYCLQFMRTPKTRRKLSEHMTEASYPGARLDAQQKEEYVKMHLLIISLAMTRDILSKGCAIRLRYARYGEKFLNSDDPVIPLSKNIERIEAHQGCVPLSPRLLMEVDNIGLGRRLFFYDDIENQGVKKINYMMVGNADRMVYFSSRNQRAKYMDLMMATHRKGSVQKS